MTNLEVLAFANHVIAESNRIVVLAKTRQTEQARETAALLCSEAARIKRGLLGMPDPDPTIDYDEDYHWDGTPLQPGEKRREKGEPALEGYDLATLPKPE